MYLISNNNKKEESPEELLNKVVDEKVESRMNLFFNSAQEQLKIKEFTEMQKNVSKFEHAPAEIKDRISHLEKAEYTQENYGELKAYSSQSFPQSAEKKTTQHESFPKSQNANLDYSGDPMHRPKDMTDLSQCYQNLDPISSFGSCNIYKVYPDFSPDLFSHNKLNMLERGSSQSIARAKEQIRNGFDKILQRDRENGYLDSLSVV